MRGDPLDQQMSERYGRQIVLGEIGRDGQGKLGGSRVCVVGCGAVGGVAAGNLARAGVGTLILIDRDIVEMGNLQRQTLFLEEDVGRPKAAAAAERLSAANSDITVRGLADNLDFGNAETYLAGSDLVLDCTDNMQTRYLINDVCVKNRMPWIYGGAVGVHGMTMTIIPGITPCLRCVIPTPPGPGLLPTCETAGVLNAATAIVGSLESAEAVKLLVGAGHTPGLLYMNAWSRELRVTEQERLEDCLCCAAGDYEFLNGAGADRTVRLCGADAVQVMPPPGLGLDLEELAVRLGTLGKAEMRDGMLRFRAGDYVINIFPDGRMVVQGTEDENTARGLYSRYVGV